jgi:phosphatidylinositol alpha-mannosyltransferase
MNKPLPTKTGGNTGLKVGFVFDDSLDSFDGVSQQVKLLGGYFTNLGHEVRYLVGQTEMKEWQGGHVYSLARNMPLPANKKAIKELIDRENFDILHVQMPYSPFMAKYVIEAAPGKTALVGTFHILPSGLLTSAGTPLLKLAYGRSLKRFDSVTAVSAAAAEFAKKTLDIESNVIPNAVDIKKFMGATVTKNERPRIVFLGRLVKRKGCLELLKAFRILRISVDAELIIAGRGPDMPKLKKYAAKHGLGQDVQFLGFIDEKDKPALLHSADIACFPSTGGESFGIVLIEAMAAGAGVVLGGNNPGYRSVLGDQPKLLIDPKKTVEFASRLHILLTDAALATDLHKWQSETIGQYDIQVVGQKILDTYKTAIAKRAQSRHN